MIKIGIFGSSGKMSKEIISEISKTNFCTVHYTYSHDSNNLIELYKADVIIDFSTPEASIDLMNNSIKYKTKIVCGTTGFTENQFDQLIKASTIIPIYILQI